MSLARGTRLGPYEILSPLGTGGMGEVYRAHDSKLNRDVALKILPAGVSMDPDRLSRFRREAQVLAALNHPNIGHIYGFEDSGATAGLVLELVEGPTLADRIAGGPIPLADAISIARQIAEALESAHEQGIVHRDLKPANIKVRDDGTAKVLDFGLAKALDPAALTPFAANSVASPTITSPAMTQMGVILGTAAYMSPEQAKGKAADKRADIWAFGVVLWEMLTGRMLFGGDTISETLAAVIKDEPRFDLLPADTPPALRLLLTRCLERNPMLRLRDIGEAGILLAGPLDSVPIVERTPRSRPRILLYSASVCALAAVAASVAWLVKPYRVASIGLTPTVYVPIDPAKEIDFHEISALPLARRPPTTDEKRLVGTGVRHSKEHATPYRSVTSPAHFFSADISPASSDTTGTRPRASSRVA